MKAVLVIGGSDSSGGAGIARDLRTLEHFATPALCALTAVTAQSDQEVRAVFPLPPEIIRAQICAAFATREIAAIKIGMLGTRDAVRAVAQALASHAKLPIVLDPVLVASSGGALLDAQGREALCAELLALATLLTPNIPEAAALLGTELAADDAALLAQARALLAHGPEAVLLKGGHGSGPEASDLLVRMHAPVRRFTAARRALTKRGTGCALASAIAAGLAAGADLDAACERAKEYVSSLFLNDH